MRRVLFAILLTAALNSNAQEQRDVILVALEAEARAYEARIDVARMYDENDVTLRFESFDFQERIARFRAGDTRVRQEIISDLYFGRRVNRYREIEQRLADSLRYGKQYSIALSIAVSEVQRARYAWERAERYRSTGD